MTESDLLTDTAMVESQYCAELASARNPFEFEQKTKNIIKRLGFSDYAFARVNTFKESDVIFATNPAEQLAIYQEEQLYEHDLVLTYARSHSRPVFLADLYEGYYELLADIELPSRRHDVYDLNKRFGYYDYYCVPAVTCNGQDRILLAVSQQHPWNSSVKRLRKELHCKCCAKPSTMSPLPNFPISSSKRMKAGS